MLRNWRRSVLPALLLLVLPVISMAQVGINISVDLAPPELPVYEQPPLPGEGYLWTPGFWAWSDDQQGYYWVPGTWVLAPQPGFLWTPGYWGRHGDAFVWNEGYWGPQIGFYGGVNYGYGYGGRGFEGGYWQGEHFYYNRSVVNVGTTNITNVYNKAVVNNVTVARVSYNGGHGGVQAQPTAGELTAAHAQHLSPTAAQQQHVQGARSNPALRASVNHGNPPIAATARPGVFSGAGVVAAKGGGKESGPAEHKAAAVEHKGAPAERAAPPAEHRAAAVEHKTAPPAEHRATPAERVAPPAERQAAAVEHKSVPAERAAPPAEHRAAPAERAAPPAQRQAAAVEHKTAPAEHQVARAERAAPPAEHRAAQAERAAPPAQRQAAAVEHKTAPAEHQAPPAERKAAPTEHKPEGAEHTGAQ